MGINKTRQQCLIAQINDLGMIASELCNLLFRAHPGDTIALDRHCHGLRRRGLEARKRDHMIAQQNTVGDLGEGCGRV